MKMPWGKHKGKEITKLDSGYLSWLFFTAEISDPDLHDAIYAEMHVRFLAMFGYPDADVGSCDIEICDGSVKTVYRDMARKWHPDKGGCVEAMQAVNEFYEKLKVDDTQAGLFD